MSMPDPPRTALRIKRRRQRRLVIGASFAVVVLVAVAVIVLLPKNKPASVTSPSTLSSQGTQQGKGTKGTSKPETTPSSTSTTDPDGNLPALATPTAADPLKVLEVGDSLGEDLGFQLQTDLPATGVATVTMDSQGDTGLANEGYFDWPAHLETDIEASHPEIVVIFLGANDGQGFDVNGEAAAFGTGPWITAYTQRVDQMIQESLQADARVVWVGMPIMQDPALNAEMLQIDSIFEQQTKRFPGTLYLPSTPVLCPNGVFTFDITSASGQTETIRTPDGVHLESAGAALLSQAVISAIDSRWHLTLKQ
jgi:hypothetical protein